MARPVQGSVERVFDGTFSIKFLEVEFLENDSSFAGNCIDVELLIQTGDGQQF